MQHDFFSKKLSNLPNQPKQGKVIVTFQEWETNVKKLKELAKSEGCSLSTLLKRLSEEHINKQGGKYRSHFD